MSLPAAPGGEPGEVLQLIWDYALETRQWPTFVQLDRRWDRGHDSDVLDVLRQLPPGLSTGSSFASLPQGSTMVGLTVAGANCCRGAGEALSVFVDWVRVATRIEREWQTEDDPQAQPSMTEEDYVREAHALPAAGRDHLVALLYLLIHSEPSVWGSLGGPDDDGHWRMTFNRGIRSFRKTASLDEYWALRYKSWESVGFREQAPAPVPGDVLTAMLSANPQELSEVLLSWIYAVVGGQLTEIVSCGGFQPGLSLSKTEDALRRLKAQGLIHLHWLERAPALPYVQLTMRGAEHAEENYGRWDNRTARDRAARNALLAWVSDRRDSPQGAVPIATFFRDPRCVFAGHILSDADVGTAAAYLRDRGLIEGIGSVDQLEGPRWARLTADGSDCIDQGGDVAEYFTPRPAGATYNFHAPVTGTNVAIGDHATQSATVQSVDADSLQQLVDGIIKMLPSLALQGGGQRDAEEAAGQVLAEVKKPQPSRARLGELLSRIGSVLGNAASQALAVGLCAAIDYERRKLGLPPGS